MTDDVKVLCRARCSCGATKAGTFDAVNTWSRQHDDSPWTNHVTSWAGPGFVWPSSEAEAAQAALG